MRARLATDSGPGVWSPHRVVPSTTPEGVDKTGRGWYQIEYWSDCKQKYTPCIGNVGWQQGPNRYYTAEDANAAIKSYGFADTGYRVKWHADEK